MHVPSRRSRPERPDGARPWVQIAGVLVGLGIVLGGCVRSAWDTAALEARFPSLASRDLGPLERVHPYVMPAQGAVTLFLCRWRTAAPITVSLPSDARPEELRLIRQALRAWEEAGLSVRFVPSPGPRPEIVIEILDEAVPTARGPGSGNTIADCLLEDPSELAAPKERLSAELYFASVRVARRTPPDARGVARALTDAELTGALVHELGHALGWQGHLRRGASAMRADVEALRILGQRVLDGEPLGDAALGALYALPSGVVLARAPADRWRTDLVDRMSRVAGAHGMQGPFVRVGDAAARIFWLDAGGAQYGLQLINLDEILRDPSRAVVVPEARVRRVLPRSRDRRPSGR